MHGAWHEVGVVGVAVVGEAEEIASGKKGQAQGFLEAVLAGDGTHGEVVGDYYTLVSKLVAEQLLDYERGERGGQIVAEVAVDDVCHHDHVGIAVGDEFAVGFKFGFLPGFGYIDQSGVGVAFGTAVAGEVFETGEDAFFAVGFDVERSTLGYDCWVF